MKTILPLLLAASLILTSCGAGEQAPSEEPSGMEVAMTLPPIETKADSIALRIMEAHGGIDAWKQVRYIRFDFGSERNGEKSVSRRHLWDRMESRYRVEWDMGGDSTAVVIFRTDTRDGQAYINGAGVDSARAEAMLRRAYRGYINDTYWLMAPVKLLDDGVTRAYVPDSSSVEYEVITTTYSDVGLTPEDQFWFWMDTETGMLARWAYLLQGAKDRDPTVWDWVQCDPFESPVGTVMLCPRKSTGGRSLMTDNIALPREAPDGAFSNPEPML